MSVAEQRYRAVLAVISDGRTVTEVAAAVGVSRQTMHAWLGKYDAGGLEGLGDGSHRPRGCPHQLPAVIEAAVLEARRAHPSWGPRRIAVVINKRLGVGAVTESSVYRCLRRAGLIEPDGRRRRRRDWKRWERGAPNELWQMDLVGGFLLADGSHAKALTGVDDHSRFCVSARLMARERTQPMCDGLTLAMHRFGVPEQILTDNGRVFTGRFFDPPTEVLFDRICRENGVEHLLTQPRSPTTTGKIERFHRTLRAEFDTTQTFANLRLAQGALDEWVGYYNTRRPHKRWMMRRRLNGSTPAERLTTRGRVRQIPWRRLDRWSTRRAARIEPATAGCPARSAATGSSASAGSRSAWASTAPGSVAMCWSPTSCSSSGSVQS
jgi:transposase InsO family protein